MKTKEDTRGGARDGSGRPALGKKKVGYKLSPRAITQLDTIAFERKLNKSETMEALIMEAGTIKKNKGQIMTLESKIARLRTLVDNRLPKYLADRKNKFSESENIMIGLAYPDLYDEMMPKGWKTAPAKAYLYRLSEAQQMYVRETLENE